MKAQCEVQFNKTGDKKPQWLEMIQKCEFSVLFEHLMIAVLDELCCSNVLAVFIVKYSLLYLILYIVFPKESAMRSESMFLWIPEHKTQAKWKVIFCNCSAINAVNTVSVCGECHCMFLKCE